MLRVEGNQPPPAPSFIQKVPPALQCKDTFDEVLPQLNVVQSPILFNRKQGKMVHENPGEHAHAPFFRDSVFVVNPDPLHA